MWGVRVTGGGSRVERVSPRGGRAGRGSRHAAIADLNALRDARRADLSPRRACDAIRLGADAGRERGVARGAARASVDAAARERLCWEPGEAANLGWKF